MKRNVVPVQLNLYTPGYGIHMPLVKSLQSVVSSKLQFSLQLVTMQCTLCMIDTLGQLHNISLSY